MVIVGRMVIHGSWLHMPPCCTCPIFNDKFGFSFKTFSDYSIWLVHSMYVKQRSCVMASAVLYYCGYSLNKNVDQSNLPPLMSLVKRIFNCYLDIFITCVMPSGVPVSVPTLPVIGTVYRNYHHSALIVIFIFPGLLPKILQPSSQEHACPTWTYACLAKHNSK